MRRFTGFFAIIAILLSLASAQAQTYMQSMTFETSDQSMWDTGQGTAGYSKDIDLIKSWEYHGKKRRYREFWPLGDFGGTVVVDTKGSAGLKINAFATFGKVDVVYPLKLTLTYPDPSTLSPGQTFTVSSSWVPDRTAEKPASLSTRSPNAGVSVRDIINLDQASVEFRVKAFSHTIFHDWLAVPSFHINEELFNTDTLFEGGIPIPKKLENILSCDFHKPAVDTSGNLATNATNLLSSNEDAFLTVRGDISNALAVLQPEIPDNTFNGREEEGYRYANAFLEWNFLDLFGTLNVKLAQNFSFTPKPMVTLNLSSGSPVTFQAGQSVQLTMPTDGSPLTITPTVNLDNQFSNNTNIKLNNTLEFIVVRVEGGVHVQGLFTKSVEYQPFDTFTLFDVDLLVKPVFSKTFTLGGFSTKTLPAFTLAKPATPLVATNDNYNATSTDGINYTLDVAMPGVLSNDTGPSGFHAIDQVGVTSDGKFAITLDTNGHFNFQGTKGTNTSYDIPYQITDNNGHAANATIHVTLVDQSIPLIANSDTYRATLSSDGTQWIVNVPAPGVLANDSGPAGFHAVAYTLNNFFGNTVVLNSDGSFHFSRPYVSGQTGRAGFLYQITDGVRLSPQTYIYVDFGG